MFPFGTVRDIKMKKSYTLAQKNRQSRKGARLLKTSNCKGA